MKKYKFFGDEYLALDDVFQQLSTTDKAMMDLNSPYPILNMKALAFHNGVNQLFMQSCAFIAGVNRVINSAPKDDPEKYIRIFEDKDPKYPAERRVKIHLIRADKMTSATPQQKEKSNYIQ